MKSRMCLFIRDFVNRLPKLDGEFLFQKKQFKKVGACEELPAPEYGSGLFTGRKGEKNHRPLSVCPQIHSKGLHIFSCRFCSPWKARTAYRIYQNKKKTPLNKTRLLRLFTKSTEHRYEQFTTLKIIPTSSRKCRWEQSKVETLSLFLVGEARSMKEII